jgi:Tol biopolymer transport system component
MITSTEGGAPRQLLRLKDKERFWTIAFTPDGRYLLFSRRSEDGKIWLWRVPVEGGEPQRLELGMEGLFELHLHPDGRQVAFDASSNKEEIWVMENFLPTPQPRKSAMSRR